MFIDNSNDNKKRYGYMEASTRRINEKWRYQREESMKPRKN